LTIENGSRADGSLDGLVGVELLRLEVRVVAGDMLDLG
jgi:hypothetical protein